jgi:hypothetical protein
MSDTALIIYGVVGAIVLENIIGLIELIFKR